MIAGKTLLGYTNLLSPGKPCLQTKKVDKTKNYLLEKAKYNYFMSKKHN